MPPTRPPGLYEELVTRRFEAALEEIRGEGWRDEIENLDPAEAPGVPASLEHDLIEDALRLLPDRLDVPLRHHVRGVPRFGVFATDLVDGVDHFRWPVVGGDGVRHFGIDLVDADPCRIPPYHSAHSGI